MESLLVWGAFGLGILGWTALALAALGDASRPPRLSRPHLAAAVALIAGVFLATLPHRAESTGHDLDKGFVIGGLAALLSAIALWRSAGRTDAEAAGAQAIGPMFLAVSSVALSVVSLRANVLDGLCGVAIGWTATGILLACGATGANGPHSPSQVVGLSLGAGFAVTTSLMTGIGVYRDELRFDAALVHWTALSTAISIFVPLFALVSAARVSATAHWLMRVPGSGGLARASEAVPASEERRRELGVLALRVISAGLLLGAVALFASRCAGGHAFVPVVAAGLAACSLAAALVRRMHGDGLERSYGLAAAATLALAVGAMAAQQVMAGFGLGLMLLACWLICAQEAAVGRGGSAPCLVALVGALSVLLGYRFAVLRFHDDLLGIGVTDRFALFGFVAGILAPLPLSRFALIGDGSASQGLAALGRVLLSGLCTLALPALVITLFGPKCLLALLFGLALSGVAAASVGGQGRSAPLSVLLPVLLALAAALAVCQWTHLVMPVALLSRAFRARVVGCTTAGIALLALLVGYGPQLAGRRTVRSTTTGAALP